MYIPNNIEMAEDHAIKTFITDYGFGVLVSADLTATHLPVIYESKEGKLGCLYGHFGTGRTHIGK
ncbi:hypothetical protein CWE12_01085 [Aliidiomarina sedimenti]|uniref:Uncharacterized protein n=1 Tax=Aliidiomarina sedimenti TaxID=1933879 RepID=A0ABY0C1G4_9GAMM|nr:hypothetical protein CWE12_01085 [Aliidiomarina sedimenti]